MTHGGRLRFMDWSVFYSIKAGHLMLPIEHFSWIYQGASIKPEQGMASDAGRGSQARMSCNFHPSYKANTRPLCIS